MSYKGYLSAQMKYDNACPTELNDYEDDTESEEASDSFDLEGDDIIDRIAYLEELQRKSSKRGSYTFFKPKDGKVGIDATVEWSKTGRGIK